MFNHYFECKKMKIFLTDYLEVQCCTGLRDNFIVSIINTLFVFIIKMTYFTALANLVWFS